MVEKKTLDEIEEFIVRELKVPEKPKARDLEELQEDLRNLRYPIGAADTAAFVDYTMFVLGAENIYAIPVANETHSTQVAMGAELAQAIYNGLRVAGAAYVDPVIQQARAVEPVKAFKVVGEALNTVADVNPADANEVDLQKLRDLAKKIDGLIQKGGYEFDIFQPHTVNLGLMLVYRQEWKPDRYQTGELLSTIPLAPGEKVKYETKTWQTTKSAQEINEATTYSTEEVLSTTKRDILDVLQRVSKKLSIQSEAEGRANWGVFSGSASVKSSLDYERESKVAKQQFREAISKSVQSIKNERKVSINIATEIGSETRMTREITNPNNEITVTYLFYELQRVYRVREYLHDAIPVVFVANELPTSDEIDDDWVIRHDWIIAGAILDKSFVETLGFITNELPGLVYAKDRALEAYETALAAANGITNQIQIQRENLDRALDQLRQGGMSVGELLEAMRLTRESKAKIAELERQLKPALDALGPTGDNASKTNFEWEQGRKKADRLLHHLRDNILHYMRAIWNAEDLNQRYLRLRSILYPQIDLSGIEADAEGNPVNPKFEVREWYPISDVVDTNHPLGFLGNYTVYRLMRTDNALVGWMAMNFLNSNDNGDKQVEDPDPDAAPEEGKLEVKIPSDAVYIEALPGTVPLLEHFKLVHRAIDKDRARHEAIKMQLENLRRLELIRKGDLGDPEIEKTVIADAKGALLKQVAGLGE